MQPNSADFLKKIMMYLLPKQALTHFAGFMGNVEHQAVKNYLIERFIDTYAVDMQEAQQENPRQYRHFNDFFTRAIKIAARPVADSAIVSPVDGYVSEIGHIQAGQILQAKGRAYTVQELLAKDESCAAFNHGAFATLYLSPKDYHRIHMPVAAELLRMTYVPGKLFSVQPATTRTIPKLFARNQRLVVLFDTAFGLMAMVLVGATIVGRIATVWHGDVTRSQAIQAFDYSNSPQPIRLQKLQEMGLFKLGSTVILLFANPHIAWETSRVSGGQIRLGQALAEISPASNPTA